jgi:hypothetical protein
VACRNKDANEFGRLCRQVVNVAHMAGQYKVKGKYERWLEEASQGKFPDFKDINIGVRETLTITGNISDRGQKPGSGKTKGAATKQS